MKRSEVNRAIREAGAHFNENNWILPPNPKWDVTDFGLGDFSKWGLVLVNLAEHEEYCEKVMYAVKNQRTPAHTHIKKKEDIIVRQGTLCVQLWKGHPAKVGEASFPILINGLAVQTSNSHIIKLKAGERITLLPGIFHEFWPESESAIIGEVSTANDDLNDNIFASKDIGRFSEMEEDEVPLVSLVSD